MMREIETWLSDSRVGNRSVVDHRSRRPVLSPLRRCAITVRYFPVHINLVQKFQIWGSYSITSSCLARTDYYSA